MKKFLTLLFAAMIFIAPAQAAKLSPPGPFRAFDENGHPCAGCQLFTYESGTTTPKTSYTDASGATPNANPVILDSDGYGDVWLGDGSYKLVLKDASDVTLWTQDDIAGDVSNSFGGDFYSLSTNTNLTDIYQNSWIVATSTFTLSLLPVSDAGEGFLFLIRNAGAGVITIDPDSSETINGSSTLTLAAGASAIVGSNGTAWYTTGTIADGAVTTSKLADASVTLAKMADLSAATIIGRASGAGTGVPTALSASQVRTIVTSAPTRQYLTSGSSATYTTPTGAKAILVKMWGGGGAGGGIGSGGAGANGNTSTFNSVNAIGGTGGAIGAGSSTLGTQGTTPGTGTASLRVLGSAGQGGNVGTYTNGGDGGPSGLGGAGRGTTGNSNGGSAAANSGSGGGGATTTSQAAPGGQAGEYVEIYISSPSASYTYTVGAAVSGTGATQTGGNGGSGLIIVEEYY